MTAALSVPTAAGPLYDVDTRLRPEGAKGMLAVSLDAFERLSAERGLDVGAYGTVPRPAGVRLGRRRRRGRRDRGHPRACRATRQWRATRPQCGRTWHATNPRPALDIKLGPGGLVDLEFAVHALQLTRMSGSTPGSRWRWGPVRRVAGAANSRCAGCHRMLVMMRLVAPGKRGAHP